MRSIRSRAGVTLLELTVTLSLFGIVSFGLTTAYVMGAKRADEALLMSETATMTGMIAEKITYDINRAKDVSWSANQLLITLYNDETVTYEGLDVSGKKYIARNGIPVISSDYAESEFEGVPVISTLEDTVSMTVKVVLSMGGQATRTSVTSFTAYWRNS